MIRLFADENFDYYLYKEGNLIYIGSFLNNNFDKEMPNFFKSKEVFYLTNHETGIESMKFQQL